MPQETPTIASPPKLKEITSQTSQPEKDRFADRFTATHRLRVTGLAIDNIVIALGSQQNNIGIFEADGVIVIGKLRDRDGKRYDEHTSYESAGLLARMISGPLIGQNKGLHIQYYSGADKERQEYVHRTLLSTDLIDPNPVK